MKLRDFSYTFPEKLIALHPADPRDSARLMLLNRQDDSLTHKIFHDIIDDFLPGDVLVMNDSRVFPARLLTTRPGGGKQEILLVRRIDAKKEVWQVIVNHAKQIRAGRVFEFDSLRVEIIDDEGPERVAQLKCDGDIFSTLERIGHVPLPPYIRRGDTVADGEWYQTVMARELGSVAAPTAGLHFTPELLQRLRDKGVITATVTLHVGPGTFLPVRTVNILEHRMHSEIFSIGAETCDVINAARREGRRVTAVGTTTTRVLESLVQNMSKADAMLTPQSGETDIFITPGFEFKTVNRLITNFHQPESTLLMLVAAFTGREKILRAYAEAIARNYRLFSYGDAMLIG